jgi:uncharacterized membrane protein
MRSPGDPTKRTARSIESKSDRDDTDCRIGPRWLGFYSDATDDRLFIPRRRAWMGKTLNFGHPAAKWLVAMSTAALLIGIALQWGRALSG